MLPIKKKERAVEIISDIPDIKNVLVYTVNGTVVKRWKGISTDKVSISMERLESGIYFFQINSECIKFKY
ncbi:MAG: T9SS type A sorting domain-containing protein [Paludibacteraceae bacterium]